MKRKLRRFWREWGVSLEDAAIILSAVMMIGFMVGMPILAELIGALFF